MNILSLFDGISCGRVALERAGVTVKNYYASEIDKYAVKVSEKNYPDIIRMGDITTWQEWDIDWSGIDLILAGSPCQGFSFAGKQLAFDDPRSKLFFVFVSILNHIKRLNPDVKFLFENVRMKKEFIQVINNFLSVEPILINSSLLSAQDRKRLYWCNWPVGQPEDKNILLKDILFTCVPDTYLCGENWRFWWQKKNFQLSKKYSQLCNDKNKAITLVARMYANWNGNFLDITKYMVDRKAYARLTIEDLNKRNIGYIGANHSGSRVHNPDFKAFTLRAACGGGAAKMGQYLFGNYPDDFYIRRLTRLC